MGRVINTGRVVSGSLRKRVFKTPGTDLTRPTSDIIKEAVFNSLAHRFYINFSETLVIDLFAGSGALGIEAISAGCQNVIFIDSDMTAAKCIRENLQSLNIQDFGKVIIKKSEIISEKSLQKSAEKFEKVLIFMDPPYAEKRLLVSEILKMKKIFEGKNLLIVVESDEDQFLERFEIEHKLKHGETIVSFVV